MKHLLTVTVVVFWIGMVALLVHKQMPEQSAPAADLAALPPGATPEREEWFGVLQGGQKIGYSHRVVARTPSGYAFSEDSSFTLAMLGTVQKVQTTMAAETDGAYALVRFRFGLISPAASFAASGTTNGKLLRVRYGPSGTESQLEIPLDEPIHLPSTLRPRLVRSGAPPGTEYTASVFSPLTLKNEPITLVLEGTEKIDGPDGPVEAVRVSEKHQGIGARAWLAPDGTGKASVACPRRAMGHLLGNGVRFGRSAPVMAAGEGIESVLSLRAAVPTLPAIAALSAAHLAALDFPLMLRRLYVAREPDAAGRRAFAELERRARLKDIAVLPIDAEREDLNADLRAIGLERLRARIAAQLQAGDRP